MVQCLDLVAYVQEFADYTSIQSTLVVKAQEHFALLRLLWTTKSGGVELEYLEYQN